MFRQIMFVAGLAIIAGCASPTPYQAAGDSGRGYADTQIENDRFRVSFSGNSITDRETVENYLLYRAAELTLEAGFDHFLVVQRATDEDRRVYSSGLRDPYLHPGFYVHYTYFHPRMGWRGWHDPFWDDRTYREVTRYEASAEIMLGRGPKPAEPNAFDARQVVENLAPSIVRPETG